MLRGYIFCVSSMLLFYTARCQVSVTTEVCVAPNSEGCCDSSTPSCGCQCPTGCFSYGNDCYCPFCDDATEQLEWVDARTACKAITMSDENCGNVNYDLAMIKEQALLDYLHKFVFNKTNKEYWIGLSEPSEEYKFQWIDGTVLEGGYGWPFYQTPWNYIEPNNVHSNGSLRMDVDCVQVRPKDEHESEWEDSSCCSKNCYICGPVEGMTTTSISTTTSTTTAATTTTTTTMTTTTTAADPCADISCQISGEVCIDGSCKCGANPGCNVGETCDSLAGTCAVVRPTFQGYNTGNTNANNDNNENQQCQSKFAGSRPATIADILGGIDELPIATPNNFVRLAMGEGSYLDTSIQDGAMFDAQGRMITLKSNGHIRLALQPNWTYNTMSTPVYSTAPYSTYYGAWGEGYALGDSGFQWENISRGLAPSYVLCIND